MFMEYEVKSRDCRQKIPPCPSGLTFKPFSLAKIVYTIAMNAHSIQDMQESKKELK